MSKAIDQTKRAWLRPIRAKEAPLGLPWINADAEFYQDCSQCGKCLEACEERIIVKGEGGYPTVDFRLGECTFCDACASVCPENLFMDASLRQPQNAWELTLSFSKDCLAQNSVVCHSCSDNCDARAIRLQYQAGVTPQPNLDAQACTGCGACVASCPTNAIKLTKGVVV